MKKIISLILLTLLFLSCSNENDILSPFGSIDYREIAYQSLTPESRESLTNCWCTAPVKSGKYKSENGSNIILIDEQNQWHFILNDPGTNLTPNQNLIAVIFNTKQDALIGPLTVIVDPNSELAIGFLTRL